MNNLFEKLKQLLQHSRFRDRKILFGLGFLILLLLTYFLSWQQDQKSIMYHYTQQEQGIDFQNGRILANQRDIYQKKERVFATKVEQLEQQLEEFKEKLVAYESRIAQEVAAPVPMPPEAASEPATTDLREPANPGVPMPEAAEPQRYSPPPQPMQNAQAYSGPAYEQPAAAPLPEFVGEYKRISRPIISFPVKGSNSKEPSMTVTLPAGSFVKAKLLTGIEANEQKALPVLLQADFAFVGPNKSRIDLTGCFLIAKSTGNLSIERVEMQTTKISCVSKSGRSFEVDLSGYVADGKDNSFAVMGEINSKQDRVAAMAFLASVVDGISGAIGRVQTTTQANPMGGSSSTVTGDEGKYIAAGGASNAASVVTQWYLKHAENLLPTINIGSGQDVWIIVQDSAALPNWYFQRTKSENGELSLLSNLLK